MKWTCLHDRMTRESLQLIKTFFYFRKNKKKIKLKLKQNKKIKSN